MSTADINKVDSEDSKTLDKQQIEAEEKEIMLKESEATEADVELRNDGGPVKAALCGDITEQGREVKPKFIPIGAIKMPGFFTRNSDREKSKARIICYCTQSNRPIFQLASFVTLETSSRSEFK